MTRFDAMEINFRVLGGLDRSSTLRIYFYKRDGKWHADFSSWDFDGTTYAFAHAKQELDGVDLLGVIRSAYESRKEELIAEQKQRLQQLIDEQQAKVAEMQRELDRMTGAHSPTPTEALKLMAGLAAVEAAAEQPIASPSEASEAAG